MAWLTYYIFTLLFKENSAALAMLATTQQIKPDYR
jgi:hypothetical protein